MKTVDSQQHTPRDLRIGTLGTCCRGTFYHGYICMTRYHQGWERTWKWTDPPLYTWVSTSFCPFLPCFASGIRKTFMFQFQPKWDCKVLTDLLVLFLLKPWRNTILLWSSWTPHSLSTTRKVRVPVFHFAYIFKCLWGVEPGGWRLVGGCLCPTTSLSTHIANHYPLSPLPLSISLFLLW